MDESTKPINYDFLRKLVGIEGLSNVLQKRSTADAHAEVMRNYHRVFVDSAAPSRLPPVHTEKRFSDRASLRITQPPAAELPADRSCCAQQQPGGGGSLLAIEYKPHDIREFTRRAHANSKVAADAKPTKHAVVQALRRLLKQPMYERTAEENDKIYQLMRNIEPLSSQVSDSLLKELATVVKLERWPEGDVTLLAHGSLFLVLHGCAMALTEPSMRGMDDADEAAFIDRCRTLEKDEQQVIKVGEMFGTLKYTEQPRSGDKILSVYLPDDGSEFLKISSYDYQRLKQQLENKDETEKVGLLLENPGYTLWSRQPLLKVVRLVDWLTVPANSVIASEGFKAPFIGYIQSGTCLLLRKLVANKTLKNGQEVQRTTHIVMSRIGPKQSFGEASLLDQEDMPCTLIAETDTVRMAVLRPDKLAELDSDTRLLIGQSADASLGKMPQEEVEREYVVQESAKEWNETKQAVVDEVINARGIRPGVGKWAK
ncbi:hypothetical protein BOX15_Mlig015972g1 [Macrostomum lignano]|uniref:Cyclic nucleotide-binding domain-containing protein n=1 Tax=Macrostomum lignano TaxID=282301 RepID=A0A267H5N5_9PLAT|nr:hypothetical protein BOX15_Mlig015972g1 [Macrostomum lignano]